MFSFLQQNYQRWKHLSQIRLSVFHSISYVLYHEYLYIDKTIRMLIRNHSSHISEDPRCPGMEALSTLSSSTLLPDKRIYNDQDSEAATELGILGIQPLCMSAHTSGYSSPFLLHQERRSVTFLSALSDLFEKQTYSCKCPRAGSSVWVSSLRVGTQALEPSLTACRSAR